MKLTCPFSKLYCVDFLNNYYRYFTWDPIKFATPHDMVANLTAKGRKLVVIIDPHIKREAGYFVHEDATENGYYVKNKDGNDYEGRWKLIITLNLHVKIRSHTICASFVSNDTFPWDGRRDEK